MLRPEAFGNVPKKAGKCTQRGLPLQSASSGAAAARCDSIIREHSIADWCAAHPSWPWPERMLMRLGGIMTLTAAIVRGCLQVCGLPMGSERLLDPFIAAADRALRAIAAPAHASRPYPGGHAADTLDDAQRRESAGLMRVNHAGEIAAQALYHGQALLARTPATRELLLKAAREETDHLGWCEQRLRELGSAPSLLNP